MKEIRGRESSIERFRVTAPDTNRLRTMSDLELGVKPEGRSLDGTPSLDNVKETIQVREGWVTRTATPFFEGRGDRNQSTTTTSGL